MNMNQTRRSFARTAIICLFDVKYPIVIILIKKTEPYNTRLGANDTGKRIKKATLF